MKNPNTKQFWDIKNLGEERKLSRSPIFIDKNHKVASYFYGRKGKLLNIGLGHGSLEKLLIKNKSEIELFGIDISTESIKKTKDIVDGKYLVASVERIPFKDKMFDFVVELDVLEHLGKTELTKSLEEVKRVIKDYSIFVISVPLNESTKDTYLNRHLNIFTESIILQLLKDTGFEIIKIHKLYAFKNYYIIKTFIAKLLRIKKPNLIIIFCRKK